MTPAAERVQAVMERARESFRALAALILGDRYAAVLFLVAIVVYLALWRVEFLINDNYATANTLVALGDGNLHIARIQYGPESGVQPGMRIIDNRLYGGPYGIAALGLPIYFMLEALLFVANFRVLLVVLHGTVVLALGVSAGRLLDRETELTLVGVVTSLALVGASLLFATDLDPRWTAHVALQLTTMVAAALIGVVLYRMFLLLNRRRTGILVSLVAVLATSITFWSTSPKRHVFTALFGVVALYAFLRSRGDVPRRRARRLRMLGYGVIAFMTWINAAEALILFAVFAPLDLLTARENARADLVRIAGVFSLGLLPFLLTNFLIAGNPLEPAYLWPTFTGDRSVILADSTLAPIGNATASGSAPNATATTEPPGSTSFLGTLGLVADQFIRPVIEGLRIAVTDPDRMNNIFLRRGGLGLSGNLATGKDTSLVESTPVLGALLALPALVVRKYWGARRPSLNPRDWSPARQTDLLAATTAIVFSLFYIPRLPLHAQITVRYLIPTIPLLLYGVGRLGPIRRIVRHRLDWFLWTYAGVVLLGSQLALAWVFVIDLRLGEAVQFHAVSNLLAAGAFAAWVALAPRDDEGWSLGIGAVLLGVVAGLTTAYVLLTVWSYFAGPFALPLVELVSDAITIRN